MRQLFFVLSFLLLFSSHILAQVTTATISGVVRDETGAVLPGATVRVRNLETGMTRTAVTDEQGRYHAANLSLGNYEVEASLAGFQTEIRSGIKLTVGREAIIDFTLKVGEITERVVVRGEAQLVEATKSDISGLVDDKKIRDLPLNGRDIAQLTTLQIGVANFTPASRRNLETGAGMKITVSGARHYYNSFLLDGQDIQDHNNSTPGSAAGILTGVETIREFEVKINNYSAEFGKAAGAVVSAVTRSGTNEVHGSIFEFHRNSALDARNFFDRGTEPPEFKRNQFGWTFGGPISKEKAFFFGSYEGLRERLGVTRTFFVPSESARRGLLPDPTTGRIIEVGVNPAVRPFLDLLQRPNGRDFGDGRAEFIRSSSDGTNEDFFVVKIDHELSGSDTYFVRYAFDDGSKISDDGQLFNTNFRNRNQYITIQETHTFSANLLNTFQFGFNRTNKELSNDPLVNIPPSLTFVPGKPLGKLIVTGLSDEGRILIDTLPRRYTFNLFQYADSIVWTKGRHFMKAGLDIKRFQINALLSFQPFGQYRFSSLRDFLTARPFIFLAEVQGDKLRSVRESLFGFYIQDDFKLRQNLTMNLGMRYEFITEPSEVDGKLTNLRTIDDPKFTVGRFFDNPSLRNFAPRFGFSYDPFKDGKMAIRGGFGIFYSPILFQEYVPSNINTLPPFALNGSLPNPPFPNAIDILRALAEAGSIRPGIIFNIEFDPKPTYMMQWNFNIQREIFRDTTVTVGYIGSRGVHLAGRSMPNIRRPEILPNGRKFFTGTGPFRNPNFGNIFLTSFYANSFYHGLGISINKRFSRGLQFQASYTLSKSIDDLSAFLNADSATSLVTAQDPADTRADRGLSNFDIRHNFIVNYTYELPFGSSKRFLSDMKGVLGKALSGWQIGGIITITSGYPFTPELTFNRSRDGRIAFFGERPNLRAGRDNNPVLGGPDLYFDPAAFELQPAGFYGNLGRNTIIGPGLANFDFSLVKNTSINENKIIQFRAEFFNIFNRANFALPSEPTPFDATGALLKTAGRITNTVTTSRQIQFALRFIF